MLRVLVFLGFALAAFGGCQALEAPEISSCEHDLLAKLKSPSSYKRVSADSTLVSSPRHRYQGVSIDYDAQNLFGAVVRSNEFCVYPVIEGRVRTDLHEDHANPARDALAGTGIYSPRMTGREFDKLVAEQASRFERDFETSRNED